MIKYCGFLDEKMRDVVEYFKKFGIIFELQIKEKLNKKVSKKRKI